MGVAAALISYTFCPIAVTRSHQDSAADPLHYHYSTCIFLIHPDAKHTMTPPATRRLAPARDVPSHTLTTRAQPPLPVKLAAPGRMLLPLWCHCYTCNMLLYPDMKTS